MIQSEKIDKNCTKIINIVNEMINHGDTISHQQVVEKILISVTKKFDYIFVITEETKDLSKHSIKEIVGWFRAHEKRRFFREDQPKETAFQSNKWQFSKFLKKSKEKNYKPKKKQDHDGSFKKVKEKGGKNSSLYC